MSGETGAVRPISRFMELFWLDLTTYTGRATTDVRNQEAQLLLNFVGLVQDGYFDISNIRGLGRHVATL
jgi:hypothetical protein